MLVWYDIKLSKLVFMIYIMKKFISCHKYNVSLNKTELIKVLLHHKADVKAKNMHERHAAYVSAFLGYHDALKLLADKDGDVVELKG